MGVQPTDPVDAVATIDLQRRPDPGVLIVGDHRHEIGCSCRIAGYRAGAGRDYG